MNSCSVDELFGDGDGDQQKKKGKKQVKKQPQSKDGKKQAKCRYCLTQVKRMNLPSHVKKTHGVDIKDMNRKSDEADPG